MKRKIGFVGCYSHDVILMLTRALGSMGKRVLLRDCNKQQTLHASVPVPEGMHIEWSVLEYDGFLFTGQETGSEETEDYELEVVDFGMEGMAEELEKCTELIVITDILLHHIRRLENIGIPKEKVKVCILRDSYENVSEREPEINDFLRCFPEKTVFFLPPDIRDVRNRYVCETLHEYNINRASNDMQEVIFRLTGMVCTENSEKEIRRCVKNRERRRYR